MLPLSFKGQPVITPQSLAESLGISYRCLIVRFERSKESGVLEEGVDFYKAIGKDLKTVKTLLHAQGINTKYIPHLVLFTPVGVRKMTDCFKDIKIID